MKKEMKKNMFVKIFLRELIKCNSQLSKTPISEIILFSLRKTISKTEVILKYPDIEKLIYNEKFIGEIKSYIASIIYINDLKKNLTNHIFSDIEKSEK